MQISTDTDEANTPTESEYKNLSQLLKDTSKDNSSRSQNLNVNNNNNKNKNLTRSKSANSHGDKKNGKERHHHHHHKNGRQRLGMSRTVPEKRKKRVKVTEEEEEEEEEEEYTVKKKTEENSKSISFSSRKSDSISRRSSYFEESKPSIQEEEEDDWRGSKGLALSDGVLTSRKKTNDKSIRIKSDNSRRKVKRNESAAYIDVDKWFSEITGCSEEKFLQNKYKLIQRTSDDHLVIKNSTNGKKVMAGKWEVISFRDLLADTFPAQLKKKSIFSRNPKPKGVEYIPLEIITRSLNETWSVDVAYLQSLPENRNAVFQVASNFNGIEAISETLTPNASNFTEKYSRDLTQGPAASISAGGGAIIRVHAPFYDPNKPPKEWGQQDRQVNFLMNLAEHYPIKNGYVIFNKDLPNKFPKVMSSKYKKLLLEGLVGYHKNVQVTSGHRTKMEKLERVTDKEQIVDQVLCAAVNINQGISGQRNAHCPNAEAKCRLVLDLAYQGTYLAAIKHARNQIFLTLIGGGAFGNPKEWIYEAIWEAHKKWGVAGMSSLQKVSLVLYSHSDILQTYIDKFRADNIPIIFPKKQKKRDPAV